MVLQVRGGKGGRREVRPGRDYATRARRTTRPPPVTLRLQIKFELRPSLPPASTANTPSTGVPCESGRWSSVRVAHRDCAGSHWAGCKRWLSAAILQSSRRCKPPSSATSPRSRPRCFGPARDLFGRVLTVARHVTMPLRPPARCLPRRRFPLARVAGPAIAPAGARHIRPSPSRPGTTIMLSSGSPACPRLVGPARPGPATTGHVASAQE